MIFQETIVSNIGWGAALALLAACVTRLYPRRPALSHGLWLLVLLKLITPSFVFFPTTPEALVTPIIPVAPRPTPEVARASPLPTTDHPVVAEVSRPSEPEPSPEPTIAEFAVIAAEPWPWRTMIFALWGAGSTTWLFLLVVQGIRLRRLLRASEPAPEHLVVRVGELARHLDLRRTPSVWLIPARVPPMLWALVGPPRLLLPQELWKSLGEAERKTILVHELAHLKRRDHWVRRLEVVVLGIYWWNPFAWWARREVEKAEEACCDAWVCWALPEAVEAYAEALVATAVFLSGRDVYRPLGASGAGKFFPLHERLNMIPRDLTKNMPARPSSRRVLMIGLLALLILPAWGTSRSLAIANEKEAEARFPVRAKWDEVKTEIQESANDKNGVLVSQPIVDEVSDYADYVGRIEAAKSVEIRSRVTGTLDKFLSHEGMIVEKGTPLFEIDPRPYQAEMDRADAEVKGKQANFKRVDSDLTRLQKLAEGGAVDPSAVALAEAELSAAESEFSVAKATWDLAKLKFDSTKISAPIGGKLSTVRLTEGNLVVADTMVLATISSTDPVFVTFNVDESAVLNLGRKKREGLLKFAIEPGLPIFVGVSDEPELPRRTVIESVDARLDSTTGTLRCRSELPNSDGFLFPGLTATVRMFKSPSKRTLLVRRSAVFQDRAGNAVHVVNDQGVVDERHVEGLREYGDLVAIREGLKETDWVIVEANGNIQSRKGIKSKRGPMPVRPNGPRSTKLNEPDKSGKS